jgi:hypothetical protein
VTWLIYSKYWPSFLKCAPLGIFALFAGAVILVGEHLSMANPYVRYALACVLVQSVAIALITLGLFGGKALALRKNARRKREVDRISDHMALYVQSGEGEAGLARESERFPAAFLAVWEDTVYRVKGSARQRVCNLLLSTDLGHRLKTQVGDSHPGKALRAIALLRQINDAGSLQAIEEALDHPSETVRASAHIALVSHGSPEQQRRVFHQLARLPFWQRVVLFQQIRDDSPTLKSYVTSAFQSGDSSMVLAALEYILSRQRMQMVGSISRVAASADLEVRIKVFKTLPLLIADEDPCTLIEAGLSDPDWRVRAMAARSCGALHLHSLIPLLAERFQTCSHPVEASHLAHALAALEGDALQRLRAFTISDSDMKRAIAAEVLERNLLRAPEAAR